MSLAVSLPTTSCPAPTGVPAGGLLDLLLREQQRTAVEVFSEHHAATPPLQAKYYRNLLPLNAPGQGEQYAFEVDLDACSGCKACVIACHNMNGLEENETWRSVGLLHGGTTALPVLQHVTTACHHCLEPACLDGCPVNAYEKDPQTGIVRHLDDQCIGCQYCILKCPYDVPRYSRAKGIVRKCDMCRDRLAVGEAPACVQACPNQAIRIAVVQRDQIAENAEANLFLPGAPEPGYTLPTTVYKTKKPLPANLLPADYYASSPQHAHWPLVLMLVLTQMSVGAFIVDQAAAGVTSRLGREVQLAAAFVLGMLGLGAATFHLGRPFQAWRAFIGWRTSWLSREVIAFGAFAGAAVIFSAHPRLEALGIQLSPAVVRGAGALVAVTGLVGVLCSVMIYVSTRRVFWNPAATGLKFLLTCFVLGIPVVLLMRTAVEYGTRAEFPVGRRELLIALMAVVTAKLLVEALIFARLRARTFTPLRRTALLMTGALSRVTFFRFLCGLLGGLLIPALLLNNGRPTLDVMIGMAVMVIALNFIGELLERYLFFAAVVAPKMPGAPSA